MININKSAMNFESKGRVLKTWAHRCAVRRVTLRGCEQTKVWSFVYLLQFVILASFQRCQVWFKSYVKNCSISQQLFWYNRLVCSQTHLYCPPVRLLSCQDVPVMFKIIHKNIRQNKCMFSSEWAAVAEIEAPSQELLHPRPSRRAVDAAQWNQFFGEKSKT